MEQAKRRKRHRHGLSNTRLFKIFDNMCQRCENPNAINYWRYGGKGVKVCEEWREDFRTFWMWAIGQGYNDETERQKERKDRLTLDRIDSDGDYCPENCRWATYKEQDNNKTNNIRVKFIGEEKSLYELAELVGIDYRLLYQRLFQLNWPLEKAIIKRK